MTREMKIGQVREWVQQDAAFACLYKMLLEVAGTQMQRNKNIGK